MCKRLYLLIVFLANLSLAGCGYIHGYQPTFTQGNIITKRQLSQLHVGMSKEQVSLVMGSPVYDDTFRSNRWTYIYYFRHKGTTYAYKRVLVYFNNGRVSSIEKFLPPAKPIPREHAHWHWSQLLHWW